MTISNIELVKLAESHNINLKITDIIMSDELKRIPARPDMNLIINLQKSTNDGTHWVLLMKKDKQCLYMDSFGVFPDNPVVSWCKRHKLHLAYNSYIIQDLDSTQCGLFCFSLLLHVQSNLFNEGIPREFKNDLLELTNDWINYFEVDTKLNDRMLKQLL